MSNKHSITADKVGGPTGLLRRILTYAIYGMAVSIFAQLLLALLWAQNPDAAALRWVVLLAASVVFLLLLVYAQSLAVRDQKARAVYVLFGSLCVISVLVVMAFPSALGLALVAPAFSLFIAIPYVNRSAFMRMSLISIGVVFILVPVSAILGPIRPAPTSLEIFVQSLPLLVSAILVVVLIGQMHGWLVGTMSDLREARTDLELKVAERTEAVQNANKNLTAEVSQRAAAQQRLSIQAEYLSALHELSLGVINCLDRETMLDAIVTRAGQLMDTPHAFIGLLDDAGDHVSVSVAKGIFVDMLKQGGPVLPVVIGNVGNTHFSGMPLIINDYDTWPHRLDAVPQGIKSCAIYPLQIHENKLAGVLVMAYSDPDHTFDAVKQEALARLSELASIAYTNILLYEGVRHNEQVLETRVAERTRELSTLLGVSQNLSATLDQPALLNMIFEQIDRLIDYDAGSIFEIQDGKMVTLHYAGPEQASYAAGSVWAVSGHHQEIVHTSRPVVIGDVRSDDPMAALFRQVSMEDWLGDVPAHIVSWIGVPIKVKDRVIGILTLDSAKPDHFNDRHAELLMAVAQQAGLALENARLYTQASKSAAQAERSRLARDLHDSVSQAIYGIVLASRTLEKLADPNDARMAAPLQHILSLSEASMAEIRALIFELRPESLEREGIVAALNKQADAIRARYGLVVEIDMCPSEPAVPLAVKEAVYRIAQEAMHNTVKHAHARHLWLKLACNDGMGVLEVRDDGVGFDVNAAHTSQMGLGTMQERAHAVGGSLKIQSEPKHGTVIRAVIPALSPAPASVLMA